MGRLLRPPARDGAAPPREPAWYGRLSAALRRVARASDRAGALALDPSPALRHAVRALPAALAEGTEAGVRAVAQRIADEVCAHFRVARLRVVVHRRRPHDRGGELHGLYQSGLAGEPDLVSVWMLTARRGQVVAFRTFLRTLVHELCHHLDYRALRLGESLHTPGFFRRESSVYDALVAVELTRPDPLPKTPHRSDATQLALEFSASPSASRTPREDDGHGEDVARCGDRTRERQRGAGEVLGKA